MALSKHEHYRERHLPAFLMERAKMPFAWGSNDCALFAADAILACTGTDIADDFRGKYTTDLGSIKTIKKVTGGSSIVDAATYCANKHGLVEHPHPLHAKRGDLVVIDNAGTLIAGVVHMNGRDVISVSQSGLVRLPITSIVRAWSI